MSEAIVIYVDGKAAGAGAIREYQYGPYIDMSESLCMMKELI